MDLDPPPFWQVEKGGVEPIRGRRFLLGNIVSGKRTSGSQTGEKSSHNRCPDSHNWHFRRVAGPRVLRHWPAPFFIHHNPGRSRFARSMRVWRQDVGIMSSESSRFPDFSGCSQFPFAVLQVTSCFSTSYPFAPQIRPETAGAFSPHHEDPAEFCSAPRRKLEDI